MVVNYKGSSAGGVLTKTENIEKIDELYNFKNREKVLGFIIENSFLEDLLLEASNKIKEYFPNARLILKLFKDMDSLEEAYLIISIADNYSSKETLERLDLLEDNWWLEAVDRANNKLSINME